MYHYIVGKVEECAKLKTVSDRQQWENWFQNKYIQPTLTVSNSAACTYMHAGYNDFSNICRNLIKHWKKLWSSA